MKYEFKKDPEKKIDIRNDQDLEFVSPMIQFTESVAIKECNIKIFDIYANHFIGGLELENCVIECGVVWTAGGHNLKPIVFRNCVFKEFVDFEDCYFDSYVLFESVKFLKGTNIMGNKGTPVEVGFEVDPKFSNVEGRLDLDTFKK